MTICLRITPEMFEILTLPARALSLQNRTQTETGLSNGLCVVESRQDKLCRGREDDRGTESVRLARKAPRSGESDQ